MTRSYLEKPLLLDCEGDRLVGILTQPDAAPRCAVVFLVGGSEYRAGSHRLYVKLARYLAQSGVASLRFDFRGLGDSEGEARSFDDHNVDISAAVNSLKGAIGYTPKIFLIGICDSATAAMLWIGKPGNKVSGVILLNMWIQDGNYSLSTKLERHYLPRLRNWQDWRRVFTERGTVLRVLNELCRDVAIKLRLLAPSGVHTQDRQTLVESLVLAARRTDGKMLYIESGRDMTAAETSRRMADLPAWRATVNDSRFTYQVLPQADHTFSKIDDLDRLHDCLVNWLVDDE